ncbi:MAG TPA: hypothetical protein VK698_13065 [Kofleriaceae bacterium]|nr:hypothetical protein [Kofleriaceae bacterium]
MEGYVYDASPMRGGDRASGASKLDQIVGELTIVCRERSFDRCVRAGRLVIDDLYRGDLDLWRRKTTKTLAFRQLAKHPRLPLSASELYRCVATYEIVTRFDTMIRWPRLTISHVRAVIGLEAELQQELLQRAHEKKWSVMRLAREASRARLAGRENRGRPAIPRVVKMLEELHRLVDDPHQTRGLVEVIDEMEPRRVEQLRSALSSVQGFCAELQRRLSD